MLISMKRTHLLQKVNTMKSHSYVSVKLRYDPEVNYSLVHAGNPFLHDITVHNHGSKELKEVSVVFELVGYAQHSVFIPNLPDKGHCPITDPFHFYFDLSALETLRVPVDSQLRVTVNGQRIQINGSDAVKVTVLPANAWSYKRDERALATFVVPHTETIDKLKRDAGLILQSRGFADFLNAKPSLAKPFAVADAFYSCLRERYSIRYAREPSHAYADGWQAVRFPNEVLGQNEGTCIDLALLFAACFEAVGCIPLIIIVNIREGHQHALIGCLRDDVDAPEVLVRDEKQIREWESSGKLLVFDPTGCTRTDKYPKGVDFKQCVAEGKDYISNNSLCYALNIIRAREEGVTPLPFGHRVPPKPLLRRFLLPLSLAAAGLVIGWSSVFFIRSPSSPPTVGTRQFEPTPAQVVTTQTPEIPITRPYEQPPEVKPEKPPEKPSAVAAPLKTPPKRRRQENSSTRVDETVTNETTAQTAGQEPDASRGLPEGKDWAQIAQNELKSKIEMDEKVKKRKNKEFEGIDIRGKYPGP